MRSVALITGASAGIGAALAHTFAQNGHEVVLTARREPELKALADAISLGGHKRPHVIPIDLAAPDAPDAPGRLDHELSSRGMELAYVVNNAGFGLLGLAADLDRAQQLNMIDLNIRTLTDFSLRWVDSLARNRGGILNVASIAAFMPGPHMAVYHATKAYVLSFSEALQIELAPRGVRVTALCPGPVPTEFMDRAGIPKDYFPRFLGRSAARVARDGYKGLMQGRRVVVPGAANKILTVVVRLLPRWLVLILAGAGKA